MPQPGMNGMEPAFGEAYGGHRGLLSPYPLAMSPLGGRTEYDQSVLLMLGSPATPRKRPFELLSDLVDDGAGFGEDLHPPERWDVSALDEMTRYTKLGLVGLVGGEPPGPTSASGEEETTVLLGRWGRSPWEEEQEQEEEEERTRRTRSQAAVQQPRLQQQQQPAEGGVGVGGRGGQLLTSVASSERASVFGEEEKGASGGTGAGGQVAGAMRRGHMVEVYQVAAQEEEEAAAVAAEAAAAAAAALAAAARAGGGGAPPQGLALEHCSTEEHNYSLCQGGESGAASSHDAEEEEEEGQAEVVPPRHKDGDKKESPPCRKAAAAVEMGEEKELEEDEVEEEDEEDEEQDEEGEGEEGAEETTVEAEDSSSSETEGEVEAEPAKRPGERPQKRRCFWEYRRARESAAKKKLGGGGGGGEVRWSLSWSSSTLPSTLYRREGKKGRRKARKTDASDLTPNPQKLHNIGEQLQKLNAAIDGMGPVNDLPAVARARSRKEKNKLASRACRLKKKAQHEANKIKLWGLNQEYENLLGALLRIKEVIRRRVESSEEEDTDERGMTQRLEDILKDSSGPLVAGRTKDFVQRILAASAGGGGGQSNNKGKETTAQGEEDEEAG